MKARSARLAALLMLVVLGAACHGSTSRVSSQHRNDGPPRAGGTLKVGLSAETDGWNPTSSQWAGDAYRVGQAVFDPLVVYGADHKPHPYLAESLVANADSTQWTIKLRAGITFHDGTPLDADALKLQLDKDRTSFLVGQAFRPLASVDKIDDLTVRANMNQPWAAFPAAIASQAGFIASPNQLSDTGKGSTDHPVGTGPYVFKEWTRDDHLTVTKNPRYWRKDVAFPDEITFRVIPDPQTRLASLESGQIDMMATSTPSQILQARRDRSLLKRELDTDPVNAVMLNTAVPPVDDVRIRSALSFATDQKQLVAASRGLGKLSTGPYLPGSPWYAPSGYPTTPDLVKARRLVDSYVRDHRLVGGVRFTLDCTPTPGNVQSMELLQSQWAKVGIHVDLKYTEQASFITSALEGRYQADCWSQLGSLDPDSDSVWWTSANANPVGSLALNFMRLKDPQIDQALQEGREAPDVAARRAAYATVWKRFAELVPYVYMPHPHVAVVWSRRLHGVGDARLPDGERALLYAGDRPDDIPLWSLWVT